MQKVIEVEEGRSFNFKASAFSPIMYNKLFPVHDFMKDMEALKDESDKEEDSFTMEHYEHFVKISYTFAYQGLAPTPRETEEQKKFREEYPDAWMWIDSFTTFSIYEILPEIIDLWYQNEKAMSKQKKQAPAPPGK